MKKKFYCRNVLIKSTLIYLYHKKQLSQAKIANKLKVSQASVFFYMKKFNISKRNPSEAVSGKLNPCFGKDFTKENNPNWKNNRCGQKYCKDCGKVITLWSYYKGKGRCDKCKGKLMQGINNLNWQGGKSFEEYPKEFNDELKSTIRKRDNYKCQLCKIKQKDYYRKLDVHHIDYDKKNCNEENLISLCHECNLRINYNRDYWYAYFTYIMEK